MAAPIGPKNLAGDVPSPAQLAYDPPAVPADPRVLQQQIQQLQNTVNELIKHYNAHTHTGVTVGAGSTGAVSETQTGAGATAQSLFTAT